MSEKQTRCPKCLTIYKVALTQLTIAQGMVCCPKCDLSFNALTNLVIAKENPIKLVQHSSQQNAELESSFQYTNHNILDIFNRRIENSNLDLLAYLNNLNYFQNDEINNLPYLNLADGYDFDELDSSQHQQKKYSMQYNIVWGLINLILLSILFFQILWFNPQMTYNSRALSSMFNYLCSILNCRNFEQKHIFITISKVHVVAIKHNKTLFSGVLVNYYEKSLQLPLLKLTLKEQQKNRSIVLNPSDYLSNSLSDVQRIPKNLPYKFEFIVNQPKNSFNEYTLEIVYP